MTDTDLPLELRQLIFQATMDLGIGQGDAHKLSTHMTRAFTAGLKEANQIWKNTHDKARIEPSANNGADGSS